MTAPPTDAAPLRSIADHSLAALLRRANELVTGANRQHQTQRGATHSLNRVALTWQAPQVWDEAALHWSRADIAWYLDTFVAPEAVTAAGAAGWRFPYTYAARARAWDGGWGSLVDLLAALPAVAVTLSEARRSKGAFTRWVAALGEHLHVQTVLSLLLLYPPAALSAFVAQPTFAATIADRWRQDTLATAIADIAANPHSRRAVVGPLGYPQLEAQLQPQMGKPPYQLFQFLPDDPDMPISSVHEHRSLDVSGGAPLDFAHDLAWLTEASAQLGRPIGDITVVAHNLHMYPDAPPDETIAAWLCRVTDGYRTNEGTPARLLAQPTYAANSARAWALWRAR